MRLLAIDTALAACSAAIYDTRIGLIAAQSRLMARGHAEALMPLVQDLMTKAKARFSDFDRIAVTVGPGSFTGLRVGVAAARGLALAAKLPAVGVTTLAAFAAPYRAEPMPTLAAVDARHDHVYMQVFNTGREPDPPRLATLQDAVDAISRAPHRIVGNAASLVAAAMPASQAPARIEPSEAPDILWVARAGAESPLHDAEPRPFYLRAPDAKPQDAARLPRR